MGRTWRSSAGIVGALAGALLAACGQDRTRPADLATPTTASECNEDPAVHGDITASATMHWAGVDHGYDQPGELFVCLFVPEYGGSATFELPSGVTVQPEVVRIDHGTGIARVEVRVAEDAEEDDIVAMVETEGSDTTVHGPTIETADDHWSFGEPER